MQSILEKALQLRAAAMQAANEYIKALATSPDTISRMSNIGYDAQSKLISSAAAYYNARTQAKEAMSRVAQYNNTVAFDAAKANQASELKVMEDNLRALLANIDMLARQATAMLNNIHASVSMSAGGSSVATQAENL